MFQVNKDFVIVKDIDTGQKETVVLTYHRILEIEQGNPPFLKLRFHDSKKYVPDPYDLVKVKMSSGSERIGWWEGSSWYCRKQRDGEEVVGWVKLKEIHF